MHETKTMCEADADRMERAAIALEKTTAALKEETAIVDRIWDIYGRPSFESLKGKSIYELIEADRFAAKTLAALLDRDICYVGADAVLPFMSHTQAVSHVAEARHTAAACFTNAKEVAK